MGTHPIFESDFDCLTVSKAQRTELKWVAVTKSASRLTAKPLVPSKWLSRVAHVPKKHESKYPIVRTIFWAAACRVDRTHERAKSSGVTRKDLEQMADAIGPDFVSQ